MFQQDKQDRFYSIMGFPGKSVVNQYTILSRKFRFHYLYLIGDWLIITSIIQQSSMFIDLDFG